MFNKIIDFLLSPLINKQDWLGELYFENLTKDGKLYQHYLVPAPSVIKNPQQALNYVRDNITYKKDDGDSWQYPEVTLRNRTGDCEDMALLLCSLYPEGTRVVLGYYHGRGHSWVQLYINKRVYILDVSSAFGIYQARFFHGYKPIISFDKQNCWLHGTEEDKNKWFHNKIVLPKA